MINRANTTSLSPSQPALGVLSDTELLLVDAVQGKRVLRSLLLPPDTGELSALLTYLWDAGLSAVWVMPDTILSRTITCPRFDSISSRWTTVVHESVKTPAKPSDALFWPKESEYREARRLALIFPEHAGWDWQLADPTSLLATVTYLEQALGRPVSDTPELLAHRLLTDLTADQSASKLRSSPLDLGSLSDHDGHPVPLLESVHDLTWMRPLTLVEQRQRYLHKYVHFSRDLEVCLEVRLGAGAPQYSSSGRAYDGIRPGIWRVTAELAGSVFDGKRLPRCLDSDWASTPQVKCCQDIGYQLQVKEGYYWPQSHDLLKRWATTLWQAVERLHTSPQGYRHPQARANTISTIKMLAQLGIAILAREQTAGGWGRPDWQAQIAGRSRALLFAHLVRLARQGTMPVLVNKDALWVVSNDPNPLTAVPGLLASSSQRRWRGYSAAYEVPLTISPEVRDTFRSAEHPHQVATALDSLAAEVFP